MRQAKDLFMLQIVLGLLAIGIALFLWERFPAFKWVLATIFGVPLAVLSIGLLIENARKTEDAAAASKASELATSEQAPVNAKASVDDFAMNAPVNSARHTPGTLKISNAARLKLLREEELLKRASATTPEARQLAQSNIEKAPAAEKKKCPDSGTLADLWDCTADVRKGGR